MSRHGGNLRELARLAGRAEADILDFSANVNPLGPPECLRPVVSRALERCVNYPDPDCGDLVEAIRRHSGVRAAQVVVGNGSTEILFALPRALGRRRAVVPTPCYADYMAAAREAGMEVEELPLDERRGFVLDWAMLETRLRGGELVFLGQPNNPTGGLLDPGALGSFASAHSGTIFIVDEAFAEFIEGYPSLMRDVAANVIVLRSLTKFYAIPGLRLGFAVAREDMAGTVRRRLPPWSVNTLAQAAGVAVLADADYGHRTRAYVRAQRESLQSELGTIAGLYVYPGAANFLLLRLDRADLNAPALAGRLLAEGIAVRTFPPALRSPPQQRSCEEREQCLDNRFFRVAVRTEEENARLCDALARLMGRSSAKAGYRPRAPARTRRAVSLMFQGTSSNAGKSVLTAALCRILLQDGVRVAPFKAQNMSLNSFVTRDGGEMGRAQVVQAQACRLEPDVRMNPILLKPNSEMGSQVIVRGKPIGNMGMADYVRYKALALEAATACYDSLASEFDAVILEGAGSPGEVNLKSHDIVNMRMARYAQAPVLVVGDIDRGGVFAAFVGTMEVLAPWERALVAGWVVNRFRGDASLLGSALDYTLAHTGRPVLGVIPYLPQLGLPEEDSVEFKSGALDTDARRSQAPARCDGAQLVSGVPERPHAVTVAVVDLPHISNFTDLDALRVEPDVLLRIVRALDELGEPDAVILPGSRNVLHDLEYLRTSGLAERLQALARAGRTEIIGICGGLQLLGREIRDPHGIESDAGRVCGLGLLPAVTTLASEKTLLPAAGMHGPSGCRVHGYEIHHGRTAGDGLAAILRRDDGEVIGFALLPDTAQGTEDHRIWGTYLHGIFDADAFRRWFVDRLRIRRGWPSLSPAEGKAGRYDIEPALDRLAQVVRENLDMKRIYRLLRRC